MNDRHESGRAFPSLDHRESEGVAGRILFSVAVPVCNEEEVIAETHRRLAAVLGSRADFDLEIVYVDDGSRDRTAFLLSEIADNDPRVAVVSLTRNFGQQAAITAGLRHCMGDAIAVLDADLQDPPEVLLQMLDKWREGYAIVYGIRRRREAYWRRILYRAFYRVFSALSDVAIPLDSGDFFVMDRRAADALNALPENRRFVRALRAWYGGRQFGLPYQRESRGGGRTKYSLGKYTDVAIDSIFSFSARPLRYLALLGAVLSAVSFAGFLLVLLQWAGGMRIFGASPPETTMVILGLLLLSGVQLLSLGILAGYLGRIYMESKGRPGYVTANLRPSRYHSLPGRGGEPRSP